MLPSEVPRLATDLLVRVFPGVWKLLSFFKTPSLWRISIPISFASLYLLYFFLPPFEDNGLLFWVPDVFCQHSEVVLWNLLSVQIFFLMNLWGRKWSPHPIPQPSYHKQASMRYQERLSGQRVFREVMTNLEERSKQRKQSMQSLWLRLGIMHLKKCK